MTGNQRYTFFHIVNKVSSPASSYDDRWCGIITITELKLRPWKDQSRDPFKRPIVRGVKWSKGNWFLLRFLARFQATFLSIFFACVKWNVCYKNLGSKCNKRLSTLECGFIWMSKRKQYKMLSRLISVVKLK